jgi:L-lactate dehydrogenase (cytochrome)
MVGRAPLWGLAANGETGVTNVLDILRAGIEETLCALGRTSIHEVQPHDVLLPDGFIRRPVLQARPRSSASTL